MYASVTSMMLNLLLSVDAQERGQQNAVHDGGAVARSCGTWLTGTNGPGATVQAPALGAGWPWKRQRSPA
jgi:hypothetical protein